MVEFDAACGRDMEDIGGQLGADLRSPVLGAQIQTGDLLSVANAGQRDGEVEIGRITWPPGICSIPDALMLL